MSIYNYLIIQCSSQSGLLFWNKFCFLELHVPSMDVGIVVDEKHIRVFIPLHTFIFFHIYSLPLTPKYTHWHMPHSSPWLPPCNLPLLHWKEEGNGEIVFSDSKLRMSDRS